MASRKKSPKKKPAPRLKSLAKMKKAPAKKLFAHVNALLASPDHGFAASVHEIHFVPTAADASFGCGDCPPPKICKRVCFINDQGIPECEDRCVDPS